MADASAIVDKVRDLNVELEKFTVEKDTLERQLAMFKERVVELSEQNEATASRLTASKATEGSLRAGRDLLSTKLAGLESELVQVQKEYQTAKSEIADFQAQIDLARQENTSLRDRLFESESARKRFSSISQQLETTLNEVQNRFAIMAKAKDTASAKLEETKRERNLFHAEIGQLTRRVRSTALKILALVWCAVAIASFAIWASYTLSNRAINEKLDGAQARIAALQKDIEGHVEKLSEQDTELTDKTREIQQLQEKASILQEKVERLGGTLLALKKEKDERIETLGYDKDSLKKSKQDALEALRTEKDAQILVLERKIGYKESQIKTLTRTKGIAIPPLIEALDHPKMHVKTSAARSLETLTTKKFGTDQKRWRTWWLENRLKYLGK